MKTTFMRITASALASIAIVTSLGVASFATETQRAARNNNFYYEDFAAEYENQNWNYDDYSDTIYMEWAAAALAGG